MKIVKALTQTSQIAAVSVALNRVDIRFHFLWELGICTGLRISDLLKLKPKDLTSCNFTITEVKTKNVRNIEIPLNLFCLLKGYIAYNRLKPDDYLFPRTIKGFWIKDKPMSRQWAWRVISLTCSRIGLSNIGTHSMRKIYSCGKFQRTGSIIAVQEELGHKKIETTLLYLRDLIEQSNS